MTEQPVPPEGATSTLPPVSLNGSSSPPAPAPAAPAPAPSGRAHTHTSGMRTSLIAGIAILIVVMIFIIQNTSAVKISLLGAQLAH